MTYSSDSSSALYSLWLKLQKWLVVQDWSSGGVLNVSATNSRNAYASFLHMHPSVELHGQPGWVAALTPLSVAAGGILP
jgi:hypothetical protein